MDKSNTEMEALISDVIRLLGEDPKREGLLKTPARVARSLQFLTSGYHQDLDLVFNNAFFTDLPSDEMVILKDIDFFSLCEHHLLPFFGKCHIAYLPKDRVVGLSKLSRVVELFCRRLQVQERLTSQIAEIVMDKVNPRGVGVVMEARHLCTMMRGVEKQGAVMTTSAMMGVFKTDPKTRAEFLALIKSRTEP